MKSIKIKWFFSLVLTLLLSPFFAQAEEMMDPAQLVQTVSNTALKQIKLHRDELEADPKKIKAFANKYVLPYMDAAKMGRYSMGRYWRVATPAQKKAFVSAYTDMLMRTYAKSLLKLQIESIEVKPAKVEKPGRVLVYTKVKQANGDETNLVFRLYLNKKTHQWLMYDVNIEGISLLLNYRKAYASELSHETINEAIEEMQQKNAAFLKGTVVEPDGQEDQ